MDLTVSLQAALLAGVISFLSPCVLPLVPSYLCFITGATLDELSDGDGASVSQQRRAFLAALMFVLGFSTVFVTLGASASVAGQLLREHLGLLSQIAGVFIIVMGLHFLGVFKLAILHREARYHHHSRPVGLLGAYGIGLGLCLWLDALHRSDPRNHSDDCRKRTGCGAWRWPACNLFAWPWHSISAGCGRSWNISRVFRILQTASGYGRAPDGWHCLC